MINHFDQMLSFQKDILHGKWPVRACLGALSVLSRLAKTLAADPEKLAAFRKEHDEYKASEEYTKWKEAFEENEDTDAIRNDPDPEGWVRFLKACESPGELGLAFATNVAAANPACAELQVKALKYFIRACKDDPVLIDATKKGDLALLSAQHLIKHTPSHPKTARGLRLFSEFAKTTKTVNAAALKLFQDAVLAPWEAA